MKKLSYYFNKISSTIASAIRLAIFLPLLILFLTLVLISSFFGVRGAHFITRLTFCPLFSHFFSLEFEGEHHLKNTENAILVGNHTSILDSVIVEIASKKPVTFIMSSWLQKIVPLGVLAKNFKVISVPGEHLRPTLNHTIERLKSGEIICIFPEGKVTLDGNLCEFKKGAAYFHQKSKIPIIPFVIKGCFEAWPWKICLPKFEKITIKFGEPYYNFEDHRKVVTEELKTIIQRMKEPQDQREY